MASYILTNILLKPTNDDCSIYGKTRNQKYAIVNLQLLSNNFLSLFLALKFVGTWDSTPSFCKR